MVYSDPPHDMPVEHRSLIQQVENTFQSVSGLVRASIQPLPTQTGDGTYITSPPSTGVLQDLLKIGPQDLMTIIETAKADLFGIATDDRKYLLEHVVELAAKLPSSSRNGKRLTDIFINGLWNDLSHPPLVSLGDEYKYRSADGSNNNTLFPQMGAANTPYARTVTSQTTLPAALPDPGTLFDTVMVRKKFEAHPNKLSSVLFYLASIIIHDLFLTDGNSSRTSSYLDLSPLYGNNQEQQDVMRTHKDGMILADCFSEKRLLGFPPGVGALLICFNRFHNYVVQQLAMINESGRFTKPKEDQTDALTQYDNDLFQTGRLITCGLYVNIILKDYVRTILNLNATDSTWDLDPRVQEDKGIFDTAKQGVGNQVSVEFNLVYRWHAAISEKDDKWTDQAYRKLFPGVEPKDVSWHELVQRLHTWEKELPSDPQQRQLDNVKRNEDGTLDDDDLVKILEGGINDVAGSFGANRVPAILRSVEILGINQARRWNVATLNEFRTYFGLTKHETFESINSKDPGVADQLRRLYDHPDYVELYPGLVVEEAKEPRKPGSGLCPSFTVARAILSDAVALVRGDRFYTNDYTPKNLTSWGYKMASYDNTVDQGHVMYKLILRAFPNHFKPDSVWAHFPFVVPSKNMEILKNFGLDLEYSYEPPQRIPDLTKITSYEACKTVLSNKQDYKVTWGKPIKFLMERDGTAYGTDFMLSGDEKVNATSRDNMHKALFRDDWYNEIKTFYENTTIDLLKDHSYELAGVNQVDIVRDVGNLAQARFAAEVFSLPMKTDKNPLLPYTEQQLYTILALVFACIFYDADVAQSFPLRQASRMLTQQLGEIMRLVVEPIGASGLLQKLIDKFHTHSILPMYGKHMIEKLLDSGMSVKDVIWSQLLPTAGGMVANQGQLFAQCLDFYLSEGKQYLPEINRLAKANTKEADDLLLQYAMEGARLSASVGLYRDVATPQTLKDGDKTLNLKPGQHLLCNLVAASRDPLAFPSPNEVRLDRPIDSYIHYGHGPHKCLGYEMTMISLTTMLKTVGKLDNLRRAPGPQGQLKTVINPDGFRMYLTELGDSWWPYPAALKVQWDGDLPMKAWGEGKKE